MRIILILLAVILVTAGAGFALRDNYKSISLMLFGFSSMLCVLLVAAFFSII